MFESGAILLYLASKSGKLLPVDMAERWTTVQWLMWQMGGVGPMMGQANHFRRYAKEKLPYPIERYTNEVNRLTNVLDKRLAESRYVACDEYTIADIAIFPWMRGNSAANPCLPTVRTLRERCVTWNLYRAKGAR